MSMPSFYIFFSCTRTHTHTHIHVHKKGREKIWTKSCDFEWLNAFKFILLPQKIIHTYVVLLIVMLFSVEARNQFKEFVNTVATIRNEGVNIYFIHIQW